VIEFRSGADVWVGRFGLGPGGMVMARPHPNQRDVVVISGGDLWIVDPITRSGTCLAPVISSAIEVQDPDGWVFSRQDIALMRFGPRGIIWHTKRLSWDGFDGLVIEGDEITGLAWGLGDGPGCPFRVDLRTGRATGGGVPDEHAFEYESLAE
jgi:hypothetical protein